ncbi:DUF2493 domain-containing protein [Daejeonella sp.]|jgi:hypothetical protein|uniref:DUF2493 domain-containing protein n=1 Tax=Daejeonella sp. TaxID=2805397 RepID=UPI0037BF1120
MKLAVIGSRTLTNRELVHKKLEELKDEIELMVSGGAKGADLLAQKWAEENNVATKIFKPEWEKYGKSAGILRNRKIIESCDYCIAFWDGISKGTKSSIDFCVKMNKPYLIVNQ